MFRILQRLWFVEIMVVSSAKVAKMILSKCGISDVKTLMSVGAKILP